MVKNPIMGEEAMVAIKEIVPSEHEEQCTVITWADWMALKHPELSMLFAIPNGGMRHIVVAMQLKAEGLRPGVPDLFLAVARKGKHGLFIEMKRRGSGQKARQGQREWLQKLKAEGYEAVICKGADAAIEVICEYLEVSDGG